MRKDLDTKKVWIWWRWDGTTWSPYRITDDLRRWDGSTFSDADIVIEADAPAPKSKVTP